MRAASGNVVLNELRELIARLDDGARLPTVRELMRTHRVSQATVQEALGQLREAGLLTSQVGRGTYVVKNGAHVVGDDGPRGDRLESLLILSNASLNERCMLVQTISWKSCRAPAARWCRSPTTIRGICWRSSPRSPISTRPSCNRIMKASRSGC